jgi:hypothetical protein
MKGQRYSKRHHEKCLNTRSSTVEQTKRKSVKTGGGTKKANKEKELAIMKRYQGDRKAKMRSASAPTLTNITTKNKTLP